MKQKILLYDLEISPMIIRTYRTWKAFKVGDVIENPYIMCFSYQWLGQETIHCIAQSDFNLYKEDSHSDLEVVKALHKLMDEADIVIAHNAYKFDNKVSQARFAFYHMDPPSPYKTIDTCKIAKDRFMFPSNHLNDLGIFLGVGRKTKETHSDLWQDCLQGDMKAWDKMKRYCKQDTKLLHDIYLVMRPFIPNHPNIANFIKKEFVCPRCGSEHYQSRGTYRGVSTSYNRYQCQSCRGWFRERLQEKEIVKPNHVACG